MGVGFLLFVLYVLFLGVVGCLVFCWWFLFVCCVVLVGCFCVVVMLVFVAFVG